MSLMSYFKKVNLSKKGDMTVLVGLAYVIILLALIIGAGALILNQMGSAMADCSDSQFSVFNLSQSTANAPICHQSGNSSNTSATTDVGAGWDVLDQMNTELGTTGLTGWIPAVIAVIIGAFFIALLSGGFGRGRKY